MDKKSTLFRLGLTLIVLICLFFILNIYSPLLIDDYLVQFKISLSPQQFTDEPVESFHDLFTNMWNHRYILNGRLANNLVMFLLYTVGKSGFNVLNSIAIILSLCAVCKLSLGKVTYHTVLICLALAILILPCVPGTIFWLAGSCNYLWVVPFICGILFYLEKYFNKQSLSSLQTAILLSCTFIASSMHEASGVILCGMLTLSVINQYRKKSPVKLLWWVLFVSIIGTSIPLSAPGIWLRASSNAPTSNIFIYLLHILPNLIPHCWLAISLLSLYLYKRGIHSILSPKGFYLLSGIACTLVFGSYGTWGGGYFYVNLAVLIFILPGIASLLNSNPKLSLSISILIIIGATILQWDEFKIVDRIIEEEKERSKNEKVFSIDIPLRNNLKRYLSAGTSSITKNDISKNHYGFSVSQKQFSLIQNIPEHRVIFNTISFNKGIYSEFPTEQTDIPVVIKINEICIIRLPKGVEPIEGLLNIENSGKNTDMEQCFLFRKYTLWEKFLVIRKPNRNLSLYSIDYQNGFFYIILPEPASHYHELTCSVSLSNGSVKKLSIDLDKALILNIDDNHLN